jgi:hypothetical protein
MPAKASSEIPRLSLHLEIAASSTSSNTSPASAVDQELEEIGDEGRSNGRLFSEIMEQVENLGSSGLGKVSTAEESAALELDTEVMSSDHDAAFMSAIPFGEAEIDSQAMTTESSKDECSPLPHNSNTEDLQLGQTRRQPEPISPPTTPPTDSTTISTTDMLNNDAKDKDSTLLLNPTAASLSGYIDESSIQLETLLSAQPPVLQSGCILKRSVSYLPEELGGNLYGKWKKVFGVIAVPKEARNEGINGGAIILYVFEV